MTMGADLNTKKLPVLPAFDLLPLTLYAYNDLKERLFKLWHPDDERLHAIITKLRRYLYGAYGEGCLGH